MNDELVKKRLSVVSVAIGLVSGLLVSAVGAVAWATQFQTKTVASSIVAVHETRFKAAEDKQHETDAKVDRMDQKVSDVKDTVDRMESKIDQLLLRGRR